MCGLMRKSIQTPKEPASKCVDSQGIAEERTMASKIAIDDETAREWAVETNTNRCDVMNSVP